MYKYLMGINNINNEYQFNRCISGDSATIRYYRIRKSSGPRIIKKINALILTCIIAMIAYMFHVKSEVQDLTFEYKQVANQLEEEGKQFNLLKAELAYLKSPKRLQALASQYLNLENIKPGQFAAQSQESIILTSAKFFSAGAKNKGKKWRYKKNNSVIHNASINKKSR